MRTSRAKPRRNAPCTSLSDGSLTKGTHMGSLNRTRVTTMTGEHCQLARVHYKIRNAANVFKIFSGLECMDFQQSRQRWVWTYEKEASRLGLQVAWNKVPADHIPVVLGSFFLKRPTEGFFNFNSFERAIKGISFFAKKLPRTVLEITDIEIVNKLFDGPVNHATIHAEYFDSGPSPTSKAEVALERIEMIESSGLSDEQKMKLQFAELERRARKPLELIERLPCNFYDDGIEVLEKALQMREAIALHHFLGNKDYSFWDLMQEMMKNYSQVPHPEA